MYQKALKSLISSNSEVMSGRAVFTGTRVPIETLFENLADGLSIDEIVESYPSLKREDLVAFLNAATACVRDAIEKRQ